MNNKKIIDSLNIVLADSYALYLKTQTFHWNVTGPNFRSLHLLFEEQYQDLASAIDEIAERIRALGSKVAASFSVFNSNTNIDEGKENSSDKEMLKQLINDQEKIIFFSFCV